MRNLSIIVVAIEIKDIEKEVLKRFIPFSRATLRSLIDSSSVISLPNVTHPRPTLLIFLFNDLKLEYSKLFF